MSSFESAPSRTSSEDRYDQDDRDSSSSYTDNGTPRASKVQKVTLGSAVDTPKKNPNRPRLPGAGPWHVDYALQPGGNAQRNKRKDLNISPDYGDEDFWPPSAGFRELVQNDYDACLAALQARPGLSTCTSNDIERRVETTFNDRSGQPSYLDISRLRVNEIVTFTFYYKKPPSSGKRKKQYDEPLGWISVKGLGWGECDIEMYNGGGPLVLEQCMTLGYSSKTGKSEFIGQHGDGMKMGINAIMRCNSDVKVIYVTGKKQWDFLYVNFDIDGTQHKRLQVHETGSKLPIVPGVFTRIRNFPSSEIRFQDFLFLHPPEKVLEAEFSGGVDGNPGRVLLDERHRQCIFVKGVLVDKSGTDTDIFFGVDILFPVKISRDRVGLEDQDELAEAVFRIWQALIKVSEEARRMYLDLLQNHPYALETANAASYLKKPEAQLLFQQLRKDKGDGVFFYTNKDGGEALRIIDHVLKKKAHLIPERLHQSWLKHDIIKTPNQARLDVFRNLQSSERYRDCSSQSQYTAHILKAFLDIIPEMNPCRDAFSFRKADPDIGVEIIPDKGKFLLHDLTLSSVYVHRSKSYEICPRYRQYQGRFGGVAQDPAARETGDQQSGHDSDEMVTLTNEFWPTIPADCVCDCSALHVVYLLIQELNHVSELQKSELNRQIQIYLRSLPRDLQFDLVPSSTQIFDDVSLDFILSWSTDDNLSDFTVYIHAVEHASTRLTNCQTAPHEIRADNDDEFTELSFPSPTNKLILNDLIPSGRNYSAQVVWKKHRAIFSPPFLFTVPPRPPSSTTVKIQRDGTTIFASWEAAPDTGADSWVVVISEEAGELIRKTVSEPTVKLKLFGSSADIDPLELTLRIYARASRDDIRSPNYALVQVEAVPNYDAHSFFDGFNSFFEPSGSTSTPVHTNTSSRPGRTTVEEIDDSEASESWKYSARMNSGSAKKSQEDRGSDQNTSFSILGRESSGQTPGPLQAATEPATHSTAPRVSPTPSSPGLEYYDSPQPQDDSGLGFGSDDDNDMVGIHSSDHNNEAMEFEGFDDRPAVPVPSDRIAIDEGISFADDTALDIPGPVLEWPVQFPPPMSTEMNFEELELDGPKTTKIIQRQKVHVGKHYNVVLKGLDDLAFSGCIQIRSIKAFEHTSSGEYVFLITVYVYQPWQSIHPEAPANGLLLRMTSPDQVFEGDINANDILQISEAEDVDHLAPLQPQTDPQRFVCRWGFDQVEKRTFPLPSTISGSASMSVDDVLEFGDLGSGAGGAACGLKEAGFNPRFGVEANPYTALAFHKNCPSAVLYEESLDSFLKRTKRCELSVIVMDTPPGAIEIGQHPVLHVISVLSPAYVICTSTVSQLSTEDWRKLEYFLLQLGYTSTHGILKSTDFGAAIVRNRVVLIAAAPGRALPKMPSATHTSIPTLKETISDLQWDNTTCNGMGQVAHPLDENQAVSRHCTGCSTSKSDFSQWDDEQTVSSWEEPLTGVSTPLSKKWKCRHPGSSNRFLSVRELARALSFPDTWDFNGPVAKQYKQVISAIAPAMIKAVAVEIKKVLTPANIPAGTP